MRVLFSSTRGAGHLQPLLPYAQALMKGGHEVMIAAPSDVSETVRNAGFPFSSFDHPGDEALAPIWARLRALSEQDAGLVVVREIFAGLNARAALPKLLELGRSWRPDVLLRESAEFAAPVAAARLGLPHAVVAVHVGSVDEMMLAPASAPLDLLRGQVGLAPDEGASLRAEPIFTSFPASLDDRQAGTPAPFRVRQSDQASSADVPAWARSPDGAPIIYITFGTITGTSPHVRSVYRTALEAVAELPLRALLTTGPGMEAGVLGAVPGNVHVEAWVSQRDVFPRVAAVVCHGGSGTVLGALAAGLPLLVVPLFADQPHNARRIAALGAGVALPNPDVFALRAAVQRVVDDVELRRGARRIADEMAALPSVESAIDALVDMIRAT